MLKLQNFSKDDNLEQKKDTASTNNIEDILDEGKDSTQVAQKSLFTYLLPIQPRQGESATSLVAQAMLKDTAMVNKLLAMKEVVDLRPKLNLSMLNSYGITNLLLLLMVKL